MSHRNHFKVQQLCNVPFVIVIAGVQVFGARFGAAASKVAGTSGSEALTPSVSGKLRTMYEVRWLAASCYRCHHFPFFFRLHLAQFGTVRLPFFLHFICLVHPMYTTYHRILSDAF